MSTGGGGGLRSMRIVPRCARRRSRGDRSSRRSDDSASACAKVTKDEIMIKIINGNAKRADS